MRNCPLPYDAVVFDLDGTINASEPGIVSSVQYALHKLGVTGYANEELRFFVGPPLTYSFKENIGLSDADTARAVAYYKEHYFVTGFLDNAVFRGMPALLRTLRAKGAHEGPAPTKPHGPLEQVLEAFDLNKYFDAVTAPSGEDGHKDKSDLLRGSLPKEYRRACMVGDRSMDMEAAAACGADGIGAQYGYGDREELEKSGATHIAETTEELAGLLLGGEKPTPGAFVTLEGSDGCGKTTQEKLIADWLTACGHDLVVTREPGGCPIAERVRQIVLDKGDMGEDMTDECEALLFAASRAQHVKSVIVPAREAGKTVLCDRYLDSSVAYQGVGRGLGEDWVRAINRAALSCAPDLTLFFDVDPDAAMRRRAAADTLDRIEKADAAFARRTYDAFRALAAREKTRIRAVDATGTPEQVFARAKKIISEVV